VGLSNKPHVIDRIGRFGLTSCVVIALTGGALMPRPAQAQTLQPSVLTADQLIAAGGATSSFCVEFPASSGMFFVAVAFSGSDTFVSTTPCDPATFVSTLGGFGSGFANDLGDTADFLLNGFQNFQNVLGAVQAHLDKTVVPQEPAEDGNFPDIQPVVEPTSAGRSAAPDDGPDNAVRLKALRDEIAALEGELQISKENAEFALESLEAIRAGKTLEHQQIANLRERLAEIENDRGAADPEAEEIARKIRDLQAALEVEFEMYNNDYDIEQSELEDLENALSRKRRQLDALRSGGEPSALLDPRHGIPEVSSKTALAYRSPGGHRASHILTPLLTQSNTQGFLLDLDALFRRDPTEPSKRSPWNFWLQGLLTVFDDDQAADRDGQFLQFIGGGSYRVNDSITVGGLATYNNGNVTSTALSSGLNSNFVGVGLFARTDLYSGILLDTVINYQHGWNDITISGASGNFGSDSIDIAAGLSKRVYFQPDWWLEPNAAISYSNMHRSAYSDSSGTAVASSTIEQGRFTFGPKIGHIFSPASGPLTQGDVFLGLNGIVDFISNGDSSVGNGLVANYPGSGVQVSGGLNMTFDNGWDATASGTYMSIGTLDSFTASVNLRIPLN